jgi:hypothetical protein
LSGEANHPAGARPSKCIIIIYLTEDEVEVHVTDSCRVSYALRYLKAISTAAGLAPRVSLSLSPHYPLLVECSLSEGAYVRFYLAPKVEKDDESDEL